MNNYQTQVTSNGEYYSPEPSENVPLPQQIFGLHLSFYAAYFKVVFSGVYAAKAGRYNDKAWMSQAWDIVKIIERHGGRFKVTGLHNMQDQGPMVIAVNHMGTLETQVLTGFVSPFCPVTFVVKESLSKGFYGPLITSRPYIAVSRKNVFADLDIVLTRGKEILDQGRSIIIFPQGTREPGTFTPRRFNSLAVKLAARSGYPILPVAVKTDFWGCGRYVKDIGVLDPSQSINMAFGSALAIKDRGREQQQMALNFIKSKLKEWEVPINE